MSQIPGNRGSGVEGGNSGNDIRGLCSGRGGPRRAGAAEVGAGGLWQSLGSGGRTRAPSWGSFLPGQPSPPLPAPSPGRSLYGLGVVLSPPPPSSLCSASLPRLAGGGSGPGRVRGPGAQAATRDAAHTLQSAVRCSEPPTGRGRGDPGPPEGPPPGSARVTRPPTSSSPAWPWRPPARLPRSPSRFRLRLFTPRRRSSPRWWPQSPK